MEPEGILCANFVTLKNLNHFLQLLEKNQYTDIEVQLIQSSYMDTIGLMRGNNPIFIVKGVKRVKRLYGIGTGPGHEELLTIMAVKKIQGASVVFAPNNKGKNMALDTVKEYIQDRKVVLLDFPMGKVAEKDYLDAAKTIDEEIPQGEYGVYLTIGDPMVYSTFIYIMKELEKRIYK